MKNPVSDILMFIALITAIVLAVLPLTQSVPASTQSSVLSPQSSPPALSFLVGVWRQPASSLAVWKARGVNAVVGTVLTPDCPTDAAYVAVAHALKLYVIAPCPEADALELMDEPDGHGYDAAYLRPAYQAEKNSARRPVFLNLDGGRIPWTDASDYTDYGGVCDWLAFDYYPLNRGDGAGAIIRLANGLDKIRLAAPGKRYMVFIECSNQQLNLAPYLAGTPQGVAARGPVPGEMQQEIDAAVSHGATGLVYFPDAIGRGWLRFDDTPPDIAAAMPGIYAKLTATGAVPAATALPLEGKAVTIDGHDYWLRRN